MNINSVYGVLLFFALVIGCATNKEFERIETLRRDPTWLLIRAAAEIEIARREGNIQWSSSAYYTPKQHTHGVWVVVAHSAYPNNTWGDRLTCASVTAVRLYFTLPACPCIPNREITVTRMADLKSMWSAESALGIGYLLFAQ